MKKFFKEFKQFISRGNIVDLSIAVIIGAAFSAIVTALTNKIIMPLVNWVLALCGGKEGLASAYTILSPAYDELGNLVLADSIYIDWGAFIAAIINFLIIAMTVFLIVKAINNASKKIKSFSQSVTAEMKADLIKEKMAVRAQAKAEGRSYKEVWKEHLEEQKIEAQEKERLEKEAKLKEEEENRKNNPTVEDLLKDIKTLLEKNTKQK